MPDLKSSAIEVSCPTCGKGVAWNAQAKWRPFCSERCRLIDLGEWLSEEKRIPGQATRVADSGDDQP